jgi:hypothetical protein
MQLDHHLILALFHIFLVAPLFFAIAFFKSDLPSWAFHALLALGIFVLLYHGYKFLVRYNANSSYMWVNAIHVAIAAPLLIYIGLKQKETARAAYEMCIMVAAAVLGYHTYSLVKQVNVVPE